MIITLDNIKFVENCVHAHLEKESHIVAEYLFPLYFTASNVTVPLKGEPENILSKKVVQVFLEKIDGKLFRACLKVILKQKVMYEIRNLTYPSIPIPSPLALQFHAATYRHKYGVELHVSPLSTLPAFLQQRKTDRTSPHAAVVVYNDNGLRALGHVVTLLCYFSGYDEYLVIDSSKENSFATRVLESVKGPNRWAGVTYLSSQADNHSCRTGALVMGRNILLFYKVTKEYFFQSIRRVLYDFGIMQSSSNPSTVVSHLPPHWCFSEQIYTQHHSHFALPRALCTQKPDKKEKPLWVHDFRDKHQQEEIQFEVRIPLDAHHLEALKKVGMPSDARIEATTLIFDVSFKPNLYLFKKAVKNKAKLEAVADPFL